MSINVNIGDIENGSSFLLPTAGTYCDSDIIVAFNVTGGGGTGGGTGGGGSLPAGLYWGIGEHPTPNQYYQTWFMYNDVLYSMTRDSASAGTSYHLYTFTDGQWIQLISSANMPALSSPNTWSFVEFDGEIHMLGSGTTYHRVFNGISFTDLGATPANISEGGVFVQDNTLKAYSQSNGNVYAWDKNTDTWALETTFDATAKANYAVTLGNDVYIYNYNTKCLYKYENESATLVATLSAQPSGMVAYNNCLYYYYNRMSFVQGYRTEWYKYDPVNGTDIFIGYGAYGDRNVNIYTFQNELWFQFGNPEAFTHIGVMHEVTE